MRRPIAFCLIAIALMLSAVMAVGTTTANAEKSVEVSQPLPVPKPTVELPADVWVEVPGTLPNQDADVAPVFDFAITE